MGKRRIEGFEDTVEYYLKRPLEFCLDCVFTTGVQTRPCKFDLVFSECALWEELLEAFRGSRNGGKERTAREEP